VANLHLLFWLSLIPFTTAWMGENHFESVPVAVYGLVLLLAGVAYFVLTKALINLHGQGSILAVSIAETGRPKFQWQFMQWPSHWRSQGRGLRVRAM
jgi:uncharacterized membrane protein